MRGTSEGMQQQKHSDDACTNHESERAFPASVLMYTEDVEFVAQGEDGLYMRMLR